MLKRLTLKHIAILDQVDLTLAPGLTVITGETGSGKSILIDGLALAFGAKVSPKDIVKTGAEQASVEILLELPVRDNPALRQILAEAGVELLPGELELLISREFSTKGSRSRVNGTPVPRETVAALRPLLIDLHGQHELTNLFDADCQRRYLDSLGDEAFQALKKEIAQTYAQWRTVSQKLVDLKEAHQQFLKQQDFLTYQLQELEAAALSTDDEDAVLQARLKILSGADQIKAAAKKAAFLLGEDSKVLDGLYDAERALSSAASDDPKMQAALETLTGVQEEIKSLKTMLVQYESSVEDDPETLQQVIDRLDVLEKLKRKYGPTLSEVLAQFERLQQELASMQRADEDFQALEAAQLHLQDQLENYCQELSEQRQKLAVRLQKELQLELKQLAMPALQFEVAFSPIALTAEGMETVTFLFSANPGEPLRPLAKVASGGELSRFLLALKVIMAARDGVGTLVFDEIDTGISGSTAKAVAEKLWRLAQKLQVLVITHQPIIAAVGDHHWHVEKQVKAHAVRVVVSDLQAEPERLAALSRLVSGEENATEFVSQLRLQRQAWQAR